MGEEKLAGGTGSILRTGGHVAVSRVEESVRPAEQHVRPQTQSPMRRDP
jgi:hypothetical protein